MVEGLCPKNPAAKKPANLPHDFPNFDISQPNDAGKLVRASLQQSRQGLLIALIHTPVVKQESMVELAIENSRKL